MGINGLKEMLNADKRQQFPDMLIDREVTMSKLTGRECSTWKTSLFGQDIWFTSEPENIKALLATKFDDFGLGPARRGNMIATLGDGIVNIRFLQ